MTFAWQTKKLGDVCSFENGDRGTNYPSRSAQINQGIPFINAGHLSSEGIDVENLNYISRERFNLLGSGKIRSGDILFCLRGSLGKVASVGSLSEGAIASSLVIVRPRETILSAYLLAYFHSGICDDMITRFKNGAAQPNLSAQSLRSFTIPLPPLTEQKRIVGILEEAFGGVARAKTNAEKNLQNARALFENRLQAVFTRRGDGWGEKRLGDIALVKGGKRVPRGYKLLVEPTGFPYLRVADFTDSGSIDMSDLRYVSAEVHRKIKNYVIFSSDMYLSIAGTIGKTGIIASELDGANLTENACRLVFQPGINNRFVYYFSLTSDFIAQAGLQTRTAAQPKLALSRLSMIKLGIPNLVTQEALVEKFDALRTETRRLEAIYQQKLATLDALKKSLLHQAFTGAL
jgi:type I restriction enzyme, S subunit